MPHHQSNEFTIVASPHPTPHESNLVSTQLIANTTESNNRTIHNSFSSSHHQTPPSPNNLILYNNQFRYRTIIASKRPHAGPRQITSKYYTACILALKALRITESMPYFKTNTLQLRFAVLNL